MHPVWDRDSRPGWQVYLSFDKQDGVPPTQAAAVQNLQEAILDTGRAKAVRLFLDDGQVTVRLRVKAASRPEAIPGAYHLVRVTARDASPQLLGEVRHVDGFQWPPPVGGP